MPGQSPAELFARRRHAAAMIAAIGRYWPTTVGVLLAVIGVSLAIAFGLPATYESTATVEVNRGMPAGAPAAESAGSDVVALFSDHGRVDKLLSPAAASKLDRASFLASIPAAAVVTSKGPNRFQVAYRAGSADAAQSGCAALADVVVAFEKDSKTAARAEQERRTKALADFVNAHPDLLLEESAPASGTAQPASKPQVPTTDFALNVLRKEKARLESELAQIPAADPSKENPYDEAGPSLAALQKQLAEVKYAIVARQKAAAAAPAPAPSAAPAKAAQTALQSEYRSLVRAVVDAEHSDDAPGSKVSASVVEPASRPSRPVKPNRRLIVGIGMIAGVWLALLTVVIRLLSEDRQRSAMKAGTAQRAATAVAGTPPRVGAGSDPPRAAAGKSGAPAGTSGPPGRGSDPPERAPDTPRVSQDAVAARATPAAGGTRIGMMDPALVRTQIGGTPADLLGRTVPVLPSTPPAATAMGAGLGATQPSAVDPRAPTERMQVEPALAPADRRGPSSRPPQPRKAPSDPPDAAAPPSAPRPSRIPLPQSPKARAAEVFAPPPPRTMPLQESPSGPETQRLGSAHAPLGPLPKTLSPPPPPPSVPPRPDLSGTKYSFVDRNRTSRPPTTERVPPSTSQGVKGAGQQPPSARGGALVEVQDLVRGTLPSEPERRSAPPPPAGAEIREPRAYVETVQTAASGEVWEKVSAPKVGADSVVPRPVSAGWQLDPSLSVANGVVGALRDQILDFAARGPFVIGVTSEQDCIEAKTVVAARLSAMLSRDGRVRVLLVEANFDFPGLHRVLSIEMPPGAGFSQQLRARLRAGERKPWTVVRCTETFHVLAEGLVRSPGVLLSQEFANALAELRRSYDVIVIDSPIAGPGVETKPIDAVSDGIAVVAPGAAALRESLDRAMKWFGQKKLLVAVPTTDGTR